MVVIAAKQGSNMLLFQRACKWGQSWDYKTQNDAFALACLKIERGVTLKVILGQNSNRCHDQIEPQRGYLGGSIFRVLVRVTVTEKQGSRVLSRIYLLGEKSRAAEGDELPRGSGAFPSPPPRILKWILAEMQSGAFWDTILRNVTACALTSSRLDDFSDMDTVMITIFFWGEGEAPTPQIP